jgi:predicted GNAT family N-acyltransferase
MSDWQVNQVPVEVLYPLRSAVLRPGLPLSSCRFDGDDDATTRHFALQSGEETLVIASSYARGRDGIDAGWQLRGMATAEAAQGKGLGSKLLLEVLRCALSHNQQEVWCNAREEAVDFYRKHGFDIISDRFHIEGVGPHFVMRHALKRLNPNAS